jgi:hypothetical protein
MARPRKKVEDPQSLADVYRILLKDEFKYSQNKSYMVIDGVFLFEGEKNDRVAFILQRDFIHKVHIEPQFVERAFQVYRTLSGARVVAIVTLSKHGRKLRSLYYYSKKCDMAHAIVDFMATVSYDRDKESILACLGRIKKMISMEGESYRNFQLKHSKPKKSEKRLLKNDHWSLMWAGRFSMPSGLEDDTRQGGQEARDTDDEAPAREREVEAPASGIVYGFVDSARVAEAVQSGTC